MEINTLNCREIVQWSAVVETFRTMGRSYDESGVDEGASALVAQLVLVLISGICELRLKQVR